MAKRVIRKQYLVNNSLQLGMALRFFICMVLVAAASGWAVYYAVWQTVLVDFHGANLAKMYHAISQRLLFYGLGLVLCLSGLSIFFTHKIAGPIYKVRRILDESVEKGSKPREIRLRKGDQFKDFVSSFNKFLKEVC